MIDLHLHTQASDGRSTPRELVRAAARERLTTIAVTDHDTVAALDDTAAECAAAGIRWVSGIEITANRGRAEVHVLGYFFDHLDPSLVSFLEAQRADRVRRVREMVERLRTLGMELDEAEILDGAAPAGGRAVGRPLIARAMVRAGHVKTSREAFDTYLAEGRPAFVERRAPAPEDVIALVHGCGGIASLAHPALLGHDDWIPSLSAAGLDAIEAYYSEHSADDVAKYCTLAADLGLVLSGGSDFHGHAGHGPQRPGDAVLPPAEFERLEACARRRRPPTEADRL